MSTWVFSRMCESCIDGILKTRNFFFYSLSGNGNDVSQLFPVMGVIYYRRTLPTFRLLSLPNFVSRKDKMKRVGQS